MTLDERIERAVRALERVDPDPPPVDRLLHRQGRRRASGAAALVVILVATAAAALSVRHRGGDDLTTEGRAPASAPAVVPWVDRPAPPPSEPPTIATTPPPADAPICRAGDIDVRDELGNGASGHSVRELGFVNRSTESCVLTGFPTATATEPGRSPVVATHTDPTDPVPRDPGPPADIAPGQEAKLFLTTERDCDARYAAHDGGADSFVYHQVTIEWSGGRKTIDLPLDVLCGLGVSRFGVPQEPPPSTPDPRASLRAALELPAEVRSGDTVRYVVDLTNPTDHPISLEPCPGYVEHTAEVKESHSLNCDGVTAIGPGQVVRYAMELRLPPDAPSGAATISWALVVSPATPGASGELSIVAGG